jgi:hypothetical protein
MTPEERILRLEKLVNFMARRVRFTGERDEDYTNAKDLSHELHQELHPSEADLFVEPE